MILQTVNLRSVFLLMQLLFVALLVFPFADNSKQTNKSKHDALHRYFALPSLNVNAMEHSSQVPELGQTSIQAAEPIAEQKHWFGGEKQTSCTGVLLHFGILARYSAMPRVASNSGANTVTASSGVFVQYCVD